jgi:hypothetical protein
VELTILGRPLRALGLSARLEAWLRANWDFRHTTLLSSRFSIEILARSHEPPRLSLSSASLQRCTLDGMTLGWNRTSPRVWFTRLATGALRLDLSLSRARIDLWFDRIDDTRADLLGALHVALCETLRATNLAPLHAAIVVRDGTAVALTGRSGVGKSSTLITMIGDGWTPIAEDFAWLDPTTRRVYGWDRGVHLTDDGFARLRDRLPSTGWRRRRRKQFIEFDHLVGSRNRPTSATLSRIIELRRDATLDSRIDHLDARSAVRALWESAGVPLCDSSRQRFTDAVPTLLRQVDVDQMIIGRTPLIF